MSEPIEQAAKAADSARKSAMLALVCVVMAIAILLVDNSIKRHIVSKATEARQILDEFWAHAGQVMNGGQPEANPAPVDLAGTGGPGDDGDRGVGDAPPGRADVDPALHVAAPVIAESAGGRAGGAAGPRGHG